MAPEDWRTRFADQHATIEKLREELQLAHSWYQEASLRFNEAMAVVRDLGNDHPDSNLALRKAVQEFNVALNEYQTALKVFTDYIMGEKSE
jgi:hypothetical protein